MFEPLVGVYRFDERDGTYSSCCTLVFDEGVATVKGIHTLLTLGNLRELIACLKAMDMKGIRYYRGGRWRVRMFKSCGD